MKIRMKTLAAGPDGMLRPGQEVDLPAREAKALIEGGYAEPVGKVRETAAVEAPEKAVAPKAAPKRRPAGKRAGKK